MKNISDIKNRYFLINCCFMKWFMFWVWTHFKFCKHLLFCFVFFLIAHFLLFLHFHHFFLFPFSSLFFSTNHSPAPFLLCSVRWRAHVVDVALRQPTNQALVLTDAGVHSTNEMAGWGRDVVLCIANQRHVRGGEKKKKKKKENNHWARDGWRDFRLCSEIRFFWLESLKKEPTVLWLWLFVLFCYHFFFLVKDKCL